MTPYMFPPQDWAGHTVPAPPTELFANCWASRKAELLALLGGGRSQPPGQEERGAGAFCESSSV